MLSRVFGAAETSCGSVRPDASFVGRDVVCGKRLAGDFIQVRPLDHKLVPGQALATRLDCAIGMLRTRLDARLRRT